MLTGGDDDDDKEQTNELLLAFVVSPVGRLVGDEFLVSTWLTWGGERL